jgi:putative phosphoesterase
MLLGIVSDTHGQSTYTREAVRMLAALEVSEVLHCGDVGGAELVRLFAPWRTHFVRGNVDDHAVEPLRQAVLAAGHVWHGALGQLQRDGCRIAFLHGDDERLLRRLIDDGQFDLVCHGHTHRSRIEQIGPTLVVNPGALYRATPHSVAVVRLPQREAEIVVVS